MPPAAWRAVLLVVSMSAVCALPPQRPGDTSRLGKDLLARITGFGQEMERTIDQLATLNPKTGEEKVLVNTFVHSNFSITVDGISTVDRNRHVLYYSTDANVAWIYSVDATNKFLQPPIGLHLFSVVDLVYDNKHDQLLVYGVVKSRSGEEEPYLVAYPPLTDKRKVTWHKLPAIKTIGAGMTFDSTTQTAYFVRADGTAQSIVTSFELLSGKSSSTNVSCPELFQLYYDTDHPPFTNPLYATRTFINSTGEHVDLVNVDISAGSCDEILLKFPQKGIVTATTLDDTTGDFFYSLAVDGGSFILSYNVRSGESTGVKIDGMIPEDIAV